MHELSAAFVLLLSLIDTGARWHQSATMSVNERKKSLHLI